MIDKQALARDLAAYLNRPGSDRVELANRAKVDPSKVSRILTGDYGLLSKGIRRVCIAAGLSPAAYEKALDPSESRELMTALGKVWDGSPSHATALAAVIRSLRHLKPEGGIELPTAADDS